MDEAKIVMRSKFPCNFIVVVDKNDGGHRICVEFRKWNAISKPLAILLPLIKDILALKGKGNYFSAIELSFG